MRVRVLGGPYDARDLEYGFLAGACPRLHLRLRRGEVTYVLLPPIEEWENQHQGGNRSPGFAPPLAYEEVRNGAGLELRYAEDALQVRELARHVGLEPGGGLRPR